MAPFPPEATCVLPMNANEYYAIQNQPSFRSLFASVSRTAPHRQHVKQPQGYKIPNTFLMHNPHLCVRKQLANPFHWCKIARSTARDSAA